MFLCLCYWKCLWFLDQMILAIRFLTSWPSAFLYQVVNSSRIILILAPISKEICSKCICHDFTLATVINKYLVDSRKIES